MRSDPVFLLYMEENIYGCGHYQSIEPAGQSCVIDHYLWSKKRSRTNSLSLTDSFLPRFESTTRKRRPIADESCTLPSKRSRMESIPETESSWASADVSDAIKSLLGQNKGRKHAKGCHICTKSFGKNNLKKRCTCGLYCHSKCYGMC